jgi:anti-sigma regulatory factor (Ser/Thr protein kinase)
MEITRRFSATPIAPATARHSLESLDPAVPRDRLDDLRVVVSELITNCVRHSGLSERDWIQMTVVVIEGRIRVEVTDRGRGFHWPLRRKPDEHGRGLEIVDRLVTRWGRDNGSRTTVWAELALP